MAEYDGGCYHDCYAANAAARYGYDFSQSVKRNFKSEKHRREIVNSINRAKLDFVRMGTSGDPSEDWEHTVKIIRQIEKCNKHIVVVTKHWTNLTQEHLDYFKTINICINTSTSALDSERQRINAVEQYEVLKRYCKSLLRVVSCRFNIETNEGARMNEIQNQLFANDGVIDTVLRVGKNNPFVKSNLIKTDVKKFLGAKQIVSMHRPSIYIGKCGTCKEMCGASMVLKDQQYPEKKGIYKQMRLNIK